jgi:hypothetical protein
MRRIPWFVAWGACLAALLTGCATRSPSSDSRPADAVSIPVDVLLPAGRNLFLFDFAQSRYQRWSMDPACALADTLRGPWADRGWLALAAPGHPFAPVAAAAGPSGHFYLLDRIGRRLALYDGQGQILSSLSLPGELKDRNPERLQLHWTRDGVFTFLDPAQGLAWQFSELRASGNQGEWRLLNRIRLPVGIESCLWEPWFGNPCCRVKSDSGSGRTVCFDRYFNARGGPSEAGPHMAGSVRLSASPQGGSGWKLSIEAGVDCGEGKPPARYCHDAAKGRFFPCPSPDTVTAEPPKGP